MRKTSEFVLKTTPTKTFIPIPPGLTILSASR